MIKFLPGVALLVAVGCVGVTPLASSTPPATPSAAVTAATTPAPTTPAPATSPPAAPSATDAPPTDTTPSQTAPVATDGDVLGDKLRVGDYQFVTMAEAEYSPDGYSEFLEPDEGNVVYAFLMEFEGIDPEGSSYNPFYFKLFVDDFEYSQSLLGKEPDLGSGDLQPGDTVRGWMSFEAPLADEVRLVYEPVMGLAGDPVEWVVTVND